MAQDAERHHPLSFLTSLDVATKAFTPCFLVGEVGIEPTRAFGLASRNVAALPTELLPR